MNHTVYFQVFDKKMKVTIAAKSKEEAQRKVLNSIYIHKVESENTSDGFEQLKNIFGIK
jgi:hypothetical protein